MGLGTSPLGTTPFAADAVAPLTARVVVAPVAAAKFDGASRAFLQNADGTIAAVHPVDQEVALALSLELGSVGAVPDAGHGVRRIKRSAGLTVVSDVQDAVRFALRRLLSRQDILILGIDVDNTTVRGRIVTAVSYMNLRTDTQMSVQAK